MKNRTRKLTSLLLALLLVISAAPAALALDACPSCGNSCLSPTGWNPDYTTGVLHSQFCYMCQNTVYEPHYFANGVCVTCGYGTPTTGGTGGAGYSNCTNPICTGYLTGVWIYDASNPTMHYQQCGSCHTLNYALHSYNAAGFCTCGHYNPSGIIGGGTSVSCTTAGCTGYLTGVWTYDSTNPSLHYQLCTFGHKLNYAAHTYGTNGVCICGHTSTGGSTGTGGFANCTIPGCTGYVTGTWTYDPANPTLHHQQCIFGHTLTSAAHAYNTAGFCVCGHYNPNGTIGGGTTTGLICTNPNCHVMLTGTWTYNPLTPDYHIQTCVCGTPNYQAHTYNNLGICTLCGANSTQSGIPGAINLTIPQSTGTYYFTSPTQSGLSVFDMLRQSISGITAANPSDYYVTFTVYDSSAAALYAPGYGYGYGNGNNYVSGVGQVITCKLSDLGSVYLYITSAGTWSAGYSISLGNTVQVASGTLAITIAGSTGSDIIYSASLGENVPLSRSDFQKFWQQYTNNSGNLSYVQITSVGGLSGTLCYNHTATETGHQSAYGSAFYLNPTAQQKDLARLTFVPTKTGNKYPTGTATIHFTAYGTGNRNAVNSLISASGTITISFTNTDVPAISYDAIGSYVNLNISDFNSVYKKAVNNATVNPYFSIKFLDVPAYGKLYSAYSATGYGTARNELTASNIGTYSFYNNSTNANSIDKVVYVPSGSGSYTDTVRYAAYSGSTLLYIGTVTFNAKELVVNYNCNSTAVTFSSYDFYYGSTPLSQSVYISFGKPTYGTLYKNYSSGNGTVVTTNDFFSYSAAGTIGNLNDVTYVPAAGFSGTVEIPFYVTTLTNAQSHGGTVKITVTSHVFTDVDANNWAAPFINRLYAAGVVSGTSATTFSPNANMRYGEALKMILLAAGYSKQSETGGNHWASNYLSLAYRNGIVSSTNVDLNAYVDRNTVAEIAAKAMGLSYATSIKTGVIGPADSNNGYVYALYNAGIVSGEIKGNTSYFYGARNISRAEMAKIICNIMDYSK